jgi:hypothetical protein
MSENSVDISGFMAMCQDLQAMAPEKTMGEVVTASVGQLLKNCIAHTPARTPGEIAKIGRGNYIKFADGTIISRWRTGENMYLDSSTWEPRSGRGQHATAPPKIKAGGMTWHEMNSPDRHWSSTRFGAYLVKDRQRKIIAAQKQKAAEAAIGLAKKSFWDLALQLGIDPAIAPGYVRNAKSPDGKDHSDEASAQKIASGAEFSIQCEITNPLLCGKLDGESIVVNGLAARQKAFEIDMEKGVFDTLKQRAKRYPGIFTD